MLTVLYFNCNPLWSWEQMSVASTYSATTLNLNHILFWIKSFPGRLFSQATDKTCTSMSLAISINIIPQKEKIYHPWRYSKEYNIDSIGNSRREAPPNLYDWKPPKKEGNFIFLPVSTEPSQQLSHKPTTRAGSMVAQAVQSCTRLNGV